MHKFGIDIGEKFWLFCALYFFEMPVFTFRMHFSVVKHLRCFLSFSLEFAYITLRIVFVTRHGVIGFQHWNIKERSKT